ncbi:MAG: hypothetical protein HY074_20190 [Deltaproteobacteria bacterium]|nr:hypothetical protein [Deltaproteobacteria bacterium]
MGVRFAPSPTGAFHIGNFRTAWISHWWARHLNVPWVVRFEDIDAPRVVDGALQRQQAELEALGLRPDQVVVQSQRHGRHLEVFERAVAEKRVYPCFCSREDVRRALEAASSAPHAREAVYSGCCRDLASFAESKLVTLAWRFRGENKTGVGDFIVGRTGPITALGKAPARESFVPAYNWACAIDDADGCYRLLVRGADLADVAGQQREIQQMLAQWAGIPFSPPAIFHCALVVRDTGERLEKRTQGVTLPELLSQEYDVGRLVACFEQSLEPERLKFKAGDIFGEKHAQLTLTRLLQLKAGAASGNPSTR